jgi:hypothetical protein
VGFDYQRTNSGILRRRSMTIAEKIEKFQELKEKIRQAIISKGVDVAEGASLSVMADKILEIKVGNKGKEKKHA